jgi:predicted O-methyltransferase YrrM
MTSALGRFVSAIVRETQTSRVLEIGTGCGRSAVHIARALRPDGLLITIERNVAIASVARRLFARHDCADKVSLIVGDPSRYLHKIAGPFDVVVQTGVDPAGFAALHERLLKLVAPGGVLITYNLNHAGSYNEMLTADRRLHTVRSHLDLGVAVSTLRSTPS